MTYSFNKLTSVTDCDVLLNWAQKERADLAFRKIADERLTVNYSSTSVEIDAVLQGVLAEISAVETVINVLPEGPTKEAELKRKVRLEYKKFVLENRKDSYGSVALLEKELELERTNKELAEIDAFITGVTTHKATL